LVGQVLLSRTPGPSSLGFSGALNAAHGLYRMYLDDDPVPLHVFGQLDIDGAGASWQRSAGTDTAAAAVPAHATLGAGVGRIYPIDPRVRLAKLEKMLLQDGIITQPIPAPVARTIFLAWWATRDALGYQQPLLYTLKALDEAGLLTGAVNQGTVYRFGRIFLDSQIVTRRQGRNTTVAARAGHVFRSANLTGWGVAQPALSAVPGAGAGGPPGGAAAPTLPDVTVVVEAHHRQVLNLSFDSELVMEPALGVAVRDVDAIDNVLPDENLLYAASELKYLQGNRLFLNVPLVYNWYRYDSFYNPRGSWQLRGRGAFGYSSAATSFMVGAGASYQIFRDRNSLLSFGVDGDVGRAGGAVAYIIAARLRFELGAAEAFFVAPLNLYDTLPFEVPLPVQGTL
ncbi:MAG TPA: hypothetical protein VFH51_01005, partial [Myxococcota bacterium]|nr:hypothetical protein [Myxococcota bacterium]